MQRHKAYKHTKLRCRLPSGKASLSIPAPRTSSIRFRSGCNPRGPWHCTLDDRENSVRRTKSYHRQIPKRVQSKSGAQGQRARTWFVREENKQIRKEERKDRVCQCPPMPMCSAVPFNGPICLPRAGQAPRCGAGDDRIEHIIS
jgi:hypothetical protein